MINFVFVDNGDKATTDDDIGENSDFKKLKRFVRSCEFVENKKSLFKNYSILLRRLAGDIRQLKLNERFHCCYSKCSNAVGHNVILNLLLTSLFINILRYQDYL